MKLIWKGLLISVLFVLLSVSVRAEFDPVFYNDSFWDNYPYGEHQFLYHTCDFSCPSFPSDWTNRGEPVLGKIFASDSGDRGWDENYFAGFCMADQGAEDFDDDGDCTGPYYARADFVVYSASNKDFYINYRVDDTFTLAVFELVGTTETQTYTHTFTITSGGGWSSAAIPVTRGWNKIVILYHESGGKDFMRVRLVDASGNDVRNHYPFAAVMPPSRYTSVWNSYITETETICNDFRDNDVDWTYADDGVNVSWYDHTKYFTTRGYLARNDSYPNFGEPNVDCFDEDCKTRTGPLDFNGKIGVCEYDKETRCNDEYDNDFDGKTDTDDEDCTSGGVNCSIKPLIEMEPWYNPSANDGADGCCGDDFSEDELFFEPFNDNSNGWQPQPGYPSPTIEDGFLKLITANSGAMKDISYSYNNQKTTFTINDDPSKSGATLRVYFMDDTGTGFFINNADITVEGCDPLRVVGDPGRMHGVILHPVTPGVERSCSITVNDVRLRILRVTTHNTGQESWVDYIRISFPLNGGDYGYVTPDNKYLCYNNKTNFYGGTEDKWMWISAPEKPFLITPLNFSGKTVDYISNSDKWYYCNADGTTGLKGLPVLEYDSFPAPPNRNLNNMECSDIATILTGNPHYDCNNVPIQYPCCENGEPKNIFADPESAKGCYCFSDASTENYFCLLYPTNPFCLGAGGFGEEEILKEICKQNERLCSDLSTYDEGKSCAAQDFGRGLPCALGNVCVNGAIVYPQGERCCFGDPEDKECLLGTLITNEDECTLAGGTPYEKTENLICAPPDQDVMIDDDTYCCFGVFMDKLFFPFSFFENENNATFSCFASESNNYFGQCCVGDCNNFKQFGGTPYVDITQNRIFSLGLNYNIIKSYDRFKSGISKIDDLAKRFTTETSVRYSLTNIDDKNFFLSYFDYIEMDVVYNRKNRVGKVYINDVPYDLLTTYSTNGDQELIPHHIKIRIKPENKQQILQTIKVDLNGSVFPSIAEFKYDNIYLTIDPTQATAGSDNHYCTGGFAAWIPQLDSEITNPTDTFFIGDDAWLEGYGRYAVTCEAQWPYIWTGHHCCGDDTDITDPTKYPEYFNDSSVPTWDKSAGCFAGIGVPEGESVWKSHGYYEDNTKFFSMLDELKSYNYSDLLYFNNTFIGCQVPSGKYYSIRVSYDGTYQTSYPQLVNTYVNDQCEVRDDYYCFNGIWRQYTPGIGQSYDIVDNSYYPATPSELHLKSIPPATELLKNGKFGGDCPPTVCAQQGNNTGN